MNKIKREYFISINIIEMANNGNANIQRLLRETRAEHNRQQAAANRNEAAAMAVSAAEYNRYRQAYEAEQMAVALPRSVVNENTRVNVQGAANTAEVIIVSGKQSAEDLKRDIINLMRTSGPGGGILSPDKRNLLIRVAAIDDIMISLYPMEKNLQMNMTILQRELIDGVYGLIDEDDIVNAMKVADNEIIYNPKLNPREGHLLENAIFRDVVVAHEELKIQDKEAELAAAAALEKIAQENNARMEADKARALELEAQKRGEQNRGFAAAWGAQRPAAARPAAAAAAAPVPKANNYAQMLPAGITAAAAPAVAAVQHPNAAEMRRRRLAALNKRGGKATRRRKLRSGSRKRLNVHRRDRR
jgi:hypothetical protein